MSDQPWMKFYPRDWRGDQALRAVSIAARGLWMECLCIMHEAKPYGHLMLNGEPVEDHVLARMAGVSVDEVSALMAELRQAGVLSVTGRGVIFSRRMTKDHARRTDRLHWQTLRKEVLSRDGEICAYCASRSGPFHVDHIMPRIRGGADALDNLVVACRRCNLSKGVKTPEEWQI